MTISLNLSKQVRKLSFNDLHCHLITQKTFQLKILCLKFVIFYFNFEPQHIARIKLKFQQKITYLSIKKFVARISQMFLYNKDQSISFM